MSLHLTPKDGWLFRITHVDNLPWLLAHGFHCANSNVRDPNFISIGKADLISARAKRSVKLHPKGTLSDYVPFYFTPKSPMMYNIRKGYNSVTKRTNDEIAILVSSCQMMADCGVTMLFTDRHAYAGNAHWTDQRDKLEALIDWRILKEHDFRREDSYPDKMERYMAEALAHRYAPVEALLGIGCSTGYVKEVILRHVANAGLKIKVAVRPNWYF